MTNKLIPSAVAAAAILAFFLLVLPAFDQTRMLWASISERKEILSEAQAISTKVSELNKEIDSRKGEVDRLDRLLPKEKELPELLSNIESIVSSSGMILSEMNLSETQSQGEIKKINGTMKLGGSFTSFINLLDLLEKNLRLIEVGTVDVSAQLIEGSRTLNYDVRFEVSYLAGE